MESIYIALERLTSSIFYSEKRRYSAKGENVNNVIVEMGNFSNLPKDLRMRLNQFRKQKSFGLSVSGKIGKLYAYRASIKYSVHQLPIALHRSLNRAA